MQRLAPDRLIKRIPQRRPDIFYGRYLVAVKLAEDIAPIQRERHRPIAVSELIFFHNSLSYAHILHKYVTVYGECVDIARVNMHKN